MASRAVDLPAWWIRWWPNTAGIVEIPCRVVDVIDEPNRQGFTYGTLPGHPESGEERFLLDRDDNGLIRFAVAAFSRPATRLARLGGPLTRATQDWMTGRYLRALDRL